MQDEQKLVSIKPLSPPRNFNKITQTKKIKKSKKEGPERQLVIKEDISSRKELIKDPGMANRLRAEKEAEDQPSEDEIRRRLSRKKPGRKGKPKPPKKTNDSFTMTEARKRALKKAQMASIQARMKKRQEQLAKVDQQTSSRQNLPKAPTNLEKEDKENQFHKIGALEQQMKSIQETLKELRSGGVFKQSNEAVEQTKPKISSEHIQKPFVNNPRKKFVNVQNGSQHRENDIIQAPGSFTF